MITVTGRNDQLAMSSFMSLTIGESEKPNLDRLVAELEALRAG